MARPKVLLIENDDVTRTQLEWALKDEFSLLPAGDATTAHTIARAEHPALVLLDLGLPPHPNDPEGGLRWLQDFRKEGGTGKVIVCTGYGDRQYAVRAVGYGAYDFLSKPVDLDLLRLVMRRACWIAELEHERRTLAAGTEAGEGGMIGTREGVRRGFEATTHAGTRARSSDFSTTRHSSGSGGGSRSRSMPASSPRRTWTSKRRLRTAGSGRTSTTGSAGPRSPSPRPRGR